MAVRGQLHSPATYLQEPPGTHQIEGWVCLRTRMEVLKERKKKILLLPGIELWNVQHIAHYTTLTFIYKKLCAELSVLVLLVTED